MPVMTEPKLISGNANRPLANAIARRMSMHRGMSVGLVDARVERFNDQEIFVEVYENVRGEDMFIIQPTSNPANDNLMELLIISDALRRSSAARITAVIPYFGYARQDRKTGSRTPISAKLVANLLETAGANRVLSVDLHAGQIQGFFDIPTDNLYAAPVMSADIHARFAGRNLMVVSPDVGGVVRARALSKRLANAPLAIVDKRRERPGESEVMNIIGDVSGRFCILVDDIVDSGRTLQELSTLLRGRRGFGFRLAVSSGQELVTDTADYLQYALADARTTLIALLLETPRSVGRLRAGLRRAAENDVPVVILPVGHSPRGRTMVTAHSGALAGDAMGWQALCADTGAVRVSDIAEFADTIELFESGRRRRPGTRGIATVHDSGAERALCADLADELGVEFADIGPATAARLDALLDEGLSAANPLDVWGTGADARAVFGGCLQAMAEDPAVAVTALAVDLVTEFDADTSYPDAVLDAAAATDAPLAVLTSVGSAIDESTARRVRDAGIPVLEGARSGLAALGHLARWPQPLPTASHRVDPQRQRRWLARLATGGWDSVVALDLLADYAIPVTPSRTADDLTAALGAAAEIGYPVALKSRELAHKSDVGGVALGIADDAALAAAHRRLAAMLGPAVSVHAMADAGVEVSVGVVRDVNFGPLVVVAAGGTQVELLADRAVRCVPVDAAGARAALESLRIGPLLHGWRGTPAVDLDALTRVVVGFSELATELGEAIDAVEANPVIVSERGAVAVDALVVTRCD